MKKLKTKHTAFGIMSAILLLVMTAIGPMDIFTHGYFYDEINMSEAADDLDIPYDLSQGVYEMHFSPTKDHFTGIEIMLTNQPTENSGSLLLAIADDSGKAIDTINVDLSRVKDGVWYKTYTHKNLKKDELYTLTFSVQNCGVIPSLVTIDTDYLSEESKDGNVALTYAYAESTFNFPTKVLLFMLIISLWLWFFSELTVQTYKNIISRIAIFGVMAASLTWNFMFNSIDNANTSFEQFQDDSEALVTGPMFAEKQGVGELNGFHLGRYYNNLGMYLTNSMSPIDDTNWSKGYLKTQPAIVVHSNLYTKDAIKDLVAIRFSNGESFQVIGINDDNRYIVIRLDAPRLLNPGKYGALEEITYINSQGKEHEPSLLTVYSSQYGLQGKAFQWIARHINDDIDTLHLLCSLATAFVFSAIVFLLSAKYNNVLAGIFFLTFWLSPWVVNFARNLYWVEFTWFLPMAIGLFCSWKIDDKKCRIGSYIAAFMAISVKCLCGYEYISAIMMGLISFLLVDFILTIVQKDRERGKLLFRTIFILGVIALMGFAAAICIHAPLRANGNIMEGIENIFKYDVLRRTAGADLNDWDAELWPSFNASTWEVFCKYFKFYTEVVAGVTGNLFPLLCCTPLAIFVYDYKKKKLNIEMVSMYVIFFFTAVSWFCLAKSHSYVHLHMNYVLWYFGFVQTCFYVIVNKVVDVYRNLQEGKK